MLHAAFRLQQSVYNRFLCEIIKVKPAVYYIYLRAINTHTENKALWNKTIKTYR